MLYLIHKITERGTQNDKETVSNKSSRTHEYDQ